MANLKLACVVLLGVAVIMCSGTPVPGVEGGDQLASGSGPAPVVPDSVAQASNAKEDLKTSDSFGLGYYSYLPVVTTPVVKYHYPLVYYPTAYLHSIRHHGYGGYGFHHHGYGVLH